MPDLDNSFESYLKNRIPNSFYMYQITCKEIIDATNDLKITGGINNIATPILHSVIDYISNPLQHIYNLCIGQGYFPSELKIGCITPIFKKEINI